jgi:hypothetical protein
MNSPGRHSVIAKLRLLRELRRRKAAQHPAPFRRTVHLGPEPDSRFIDRFQPWQEADFAALDAAWLALAGRGPQAAVRRAYIERPRGHSKTTDTAVQLA